MRASALERGVKLDVDVLVVEDDDARGTLVANVLRSAGYRVAEASTFGPRALAFGRSPAFGTSLPMAKSARSEQSDWKETLRPARGFYGKSVSAPEATDCGLGNDSRSTG